MVLDFDISRKNSKIYAIVITFNPEIHLLEAEYQSVVKQVDGIIYIDNNSKNRSEIKTWAGTKVNSFFIWLEDNEGIGVAQNAGIRQALNEGASHVIIFDQDSVINGNFVSKLYETEQRAIHKGIKVGLTGPIYKSYEDDYLYPVWSIENGRMVPIPQENIDDYRVVSHIIASGSLIRREVIEKVGLMREDLFLGYIDFEYCFRAAQYGYVSIATNNAYMYHQMGDRQIVILGRKIGIYSPFRRYFDCRNTLLIQKEEVFPEVFRRHYLRLIGGKVIISIIYGPSRLKQIHYCLKGFYDGLKGQKGKCTLRIMQKNMVPR